MPAATVPPSKRKPKRRSRTTRTFNPDKAVALAKAGLTAEDIALHQGVHPTTISRFLQAHKAEAVETDIYKKDRPEIFARLQAKALETQDRVLNTITDGVLAAAKLTEKAMILNAINNVFGTIYDKERLERGQSTSNVSLIGRMMGSALTESYRPTTSSGPALPEADEKSHT